MSRDRVYLLQADASVLIGVFSDLKSQIQYKWTLIDSICAFMGDTGWASNCALLNIPVSGVWSMQLVSEFGDKIGLKRMSWYEKF